jgi:hypothetical protein
MKPGNDASRARELPHVRCGGCGANLPVDPFSDRVTCRHCALVRPVSETVRREAQAHRNELRVAWIAELEARRAEMMHSRAATLNPFALVAILSFSVLVTYWLVVWAAGVAAVMGHRVNAVAVTITLAATFGASKLLCAMVRPPSVELLLATGLGACPTCGGPCRMTEGHATTTCGFCGATLLMTPELRRELIGCAAARVGVARTDRLEAERRNWAIARSPWVVRLSVTLCLLATCALTGLTLWGLVMRDRVEPVFVGWIAPVLLLGGALATWSLVRDVRNAMAASRDFQANLHGLFDAPGSTLTRTPPQPRD